MRHAAPLLAFVAVTLAAAIQTTARAASNRHAAASQTLTVRIYDYARIPDPTLFRALDETRKILRKTGIEVRSLRCRVALSEAVLDACHAEPTGPLVIQVRILPEEMASLAGLNVRVFGFAMTAARPDFGVIANVFYRRVQQLTDEYGYRGYHEGVVLGYVLSHEIGHLLLGRGEHSDRGIMRMPWNETELSLAHRGRLDFTRIEAARIRRDVEDRTNAQRAKDLPQEVLVGTPGEAATRAGG